MEVRGTRQHLEERPRRAVNPIPSRARKARAHVQPRKKNRSNGRSHGDNDGFNREHQESASRGDGGKGNVMATRLSGGANTIAGYIERFRKQPPMSPGQRKKELAHNAKDFWWKEAEKVPEAEEYASFPVGDFSLDAILSRVDLDESQHCNPVHVCEEVENLEQVRELNRKADAILAKHRGDAENEDNELQEACKNVISEHLKRSSMNWSLRDSLNISECSELDGLAVLDSSQGEVQTKQGDSQLFNLSQSQSEVHVYVHVTNESESTNKKSNMGRDIQTEKETQTAFVQADGLSLSLSDLGIDTDLVEESKPDLVEEKKPVSFTEDILVNGLMNNDSTRAGHVGEEENRVIPKNDSKNSTACNSIQSENRVPDSEENGTPLSVSELEKHPTDELIEEEFDSNKPSPRSAGVHPIFSIDKIPLSLTQNDFEREDFAPTTDDTPVDVPGGADTRLGEDTLQNTQPVDQLSPKECAQGQEQTAEPDDNQQDAPISTIDRTEAVDHHQQEVLVSLENCTGAVDRQQGAAIPLKDYTEAVDSQQGAVVSLKDCNEAVDNQQGASFSLENNIQGPEYNTETGDEAQIQRDNLLIEEPGSEAQLALPKENNLNASEIGVEISIQKQPDISTIHPPVEPIIEVIEGASLQASQTITLSNQQLLQEYAEIQEHKSEHGFISTGREHAVDDSTPVQCDGHVADGDVDTQGGKQDATTWTGFDEDLVDFETIVLGQNVKPMGANKGTNVEMFNVAEVQTQAQDSETSIESLIAQKLDEEIEPPQSEGTGPQAYILDKDILEKDAVCFLLKERINELREQLEQLEAQERAIRSHGL